MHQVLAWLPASVFTADSLPQEDNFTHCLLSTSSDNTLTHTHTQQRLHCSKGAVAQKHTQITTAQLTFTPQRERELISLNTGCRMYVSGVHTHTNTHGTPAKKCQRITHFYSDRSQITQTAALNAQMGLPRKMYPENVSDQGVLTRKRGRRVTFMFVIKTACFSSGFSPLGSKKTLFSIP